MEHIKPYTPAEHEILELEHFMQFDDEAVANGLSVPLMMEQAGYQTARVAAHRFTPGAKILVGVGPGNNGGGGLVAARRLKAWGYQVTLHLPRTGGNENFREQLYRCKQFGIPYQPDWDADGFIDAYLGFSQRAPLEGDFAAAVNHMQAMKKSTISLDIPSGYADEKNGLLPDCIVCLAAPKKVLMPFLNKAEIYIADLGIPETMYQKHGFKQMPPFMGEGIIKWEA